MSDKIELDTWTDLPSSFVLTEHLQKTLKINVNFTIHKTLYEQFKRVAQKDMRKYSNIIEGSIRRYVQSKI